MAVVTFDHAEFKEIYPQFANFSDERLTFYFDMACVLVDNTERSRIPYNPPEVNTRKIILYALVCHFAELFLRGGGVVGALTSATEGSVSTGFSMPVNPNSAWYNQTQCGAFAYQLLLQFMLGGRAYRGCFR